jgi:hypothetical protein
VQDPAELWNTDLMQREELFAELLKSTGSAVNCLADNRWSGIAFSDAKRDPKVSIRPAPADAVAEAPKSKVPGESSKQTKSAEFALLCLVLLLNTCIIGFQCVQPWLAVLQSWVQERKKSMRSPSHCRGYFQSQAMQPPERTAYPLKGCPRLQEPFGVHLVPAVPVWTSPLVPRCLSELLVFLISALG